MITPQSELEKEFYTVHFEQAYDLRGFMEKHGRLKVPPRATMEQYEYVIGVLKRGLESDDIDPQRLEKLARQGMFDAFLRLAREGKGRPYREVAMIVHWHPVGPDDPRKASAIAIDGDFPPERIAAWPTYQYHALELEPSIFVNSRRSEGVLLHAYAHPRFDEKNLIGIAILLDGRGELGSSKGRVK